MNKNELILASDSFEPLVVDTEQFYFYLMLKHLCNIEEYDFKIPEFIENEITTTEFIDIDQCKYNLFIMLQRKFYTA